MKQASEHPSHDPASRKSRRGALALAAASLMLGSLTALAGGGGAPPTTSAPGTGTPALRVTTTLAGMKTLPLRTPWAITTNVPQATLASVQFFIDGRLASTPRDAPYTYGGIGNNGVASHLVTTWLSPGPHTFTTTVTAIDGRTASETVVANVVAPPEPPAALAGAWERVITVQDFQAAGLSAQADPVLASLLERPWRIIFDRAGVWIVDPEPGGVPEHVVVRGNTISVPNGIHIGSSGTVTAYGAPMGGGGGGVCAHGEEGTFTWSVAGDTLTLTTTNPGCASRQAIYTGTWTRVKNPPARDLTFTQAR